MVPNFLLFMLALSGPNVEQPPQNGITVVGVRDPQAEAALAECLKSACSPSADANASLRVANALFVAGRYDEAHATLRKALARARRTGTGHPKLRAALYQAQATIAQHRGDMAEAIGENRRAVYALALGEGRTSSDALAAQIDLGNVLAQAGRKLEARRAYRLVAQTAKASGQENMGYAADVLEAWLDYKTGNETSSKAKLTEISMLDSPSLYLARISAATLLAKIGRDHKDLRPTDKLIEILSHEEHRVDPLLIYAAPLSTPTANVVSFPTLNSVVASNSSDRNRNEWVDLGYWIRPTGNVDDVQILRGSGDEYWVKSIIPIIQTRRYALMDKEADSLGFYHVIRLSLGYPMVTPMNSLIARRAGQPSISELDLAKSDWPEPPTADN